MDPGFWGFIGALVGAIVGASASVATTTITSWNTFRLQKSAHELERAERARAFQRDTLLRAQEALQELMRLTGRAHSADLQAFREKGEWGKNMLGEDINENLLLLNRKVHALIERVSNESLRVELKRVHAGTTDVISAKSMDEARENLRSLATAYERVMENLGRVLRENY